MFGKYFIILVFLINCSLIIGRVIDTNNNNNDMVDLRNLLKFQNYKDGHLAGQQYRHLQNNDDNSNAELYEDGYLNMFDDQNAHLRKFYDHKRGHIWKRK